jgi:hypothetical protein
MVNIKKNIFTLFQWSLLVTALSYFIFPYFPRQSFVLAGKSFFLTQPLMLISLFVVILACVLSQDARDRILAVGELWRTWSYFPAVFLLLCVSSLIAFGASGVAFSRLLSIAAPALLLGLFALISKKFIHYFFVMSAWVTIFASVLGVTQFFFVGIFSPEMYFGDGAPEFYAVGFANMSSLFALHLSIFSLIFWLFFITRYAGMQKIWGAAFFISIPAFILTFSQGAWLAVVVAGMGGLIWLVRSGYCMRRIALSLVIASTIAGGAFFAPKIIPTRVPVQFAEGQEEVAVRTFSAVSANSNRTRATFHQASWELIRKNPRTFLIGHGVWAFSDYSRSLDLIVRKSPTTDPHSTFLELVTSGGVLSLVLFLGGAWSLISASITKQRSNIISFALTMAFIAILVNGLTHTHLYTKYMWIIIGLMVASLSFIDHLKKNKG